MSITNPLLESRLTGINEAQKRARVAVFLLTLASTAIFATLWNAYFSWDRQWAYMNQKPTSWGQEQLLIQEIGAWLQSNTVDVSLLGIRLSASDAAVLGSFVLLIFAYHHCLCKKRENYEIGSLLVEMKESKSEVKKLIAQRIQSYMIFNEIRDKRTVFCSLQQRTSKRPMIFERFGFKLLTYLPLLTVGFILFTDIYFSFFYVSPFRENPGTAWQALSHSYQCQLVLTDSFGFIIGLAIFYFCRCASIFHAGTSEITQEFNEIAITSSEIDT